MSSRSLQALAFAVSALATTGVAATADAADLSPMGAAPPPLTQQRPVELGTGWYLRGDIGFVSEKPLQLNNEANLSAKRRNLLGGGFGFGYKFNNWLRADMTYDWRQTLGDNQSAFAPCVTSSAGGVFTTANCAVSHASKLKQHLYLANGYVDLGTWSGVTPYVGAGLGIANLGVSGSNNYLNAGVAPAGSIVDSVTGATYSFDYKHAPSAGHLPPTGGAHLRGWLHDGEPPKRRGAAPLFSLTARMFSSGPCAKRPGWSPKSPLTRRSAARIAPRSARRS
jgi:opacity protein-like surface antigen